MCFFAKNNREHLRLSERNYSIDHVIQAMTIKSENAF